MKKIGPVVVGIGLVVKNGRVLLGKRRSKVKEWCKWEIPGGAVEFGEDVKDTIKRELMEEFGIKVKPKKLVNLIYKNVWKLKDRQIHVILIGYVCDLIDGEPKPCDEDVEKIGWFTLEEVETLDCLPGTKEFVREVLKDKHFRT